MGSLRSAAPQPNCGRRAGSRPHGGENALFTRNTGFLIVPLWLAAMAWLFAHDVLPAWTAQDPPRVSVDEWLQKQGRRAQFSIYTGNRPIGSIWTEYIVGDDAVQRYDVVWIEEFPIPVVPVRLMLSSSFTPDGLIDAFTVLLDTPEERTSFKLHGERFHADFSFTFQKGTREDVFKIPLTEGQVIGGALSPFFHYRDLQVGQSWRMQVFNPVAALTGLGGSFTSMVVRVSGEEVLAIGGELKRCVVVESPHVKAWVDEDGAVQVQQIALPLLGTVRLVRERDFDEQSLGAKRAYVFHSANDEQ